MKFDSRIERTGAAFSVIFFAIEAVFPFFIYFMISSNDRSLTKEDFIKKFGAIYEGLKVDTWLIIYYNTLLILRKIILAFTVTLLGDYQGL